MDVTSTIASDARHFWAQTAADALPRGRYLALVTALVAALFAVHLALLDPTSIWAGDDSHYVMHALNLVNGRPYAETGYLQNPDRFIGPLRYPPGYPLLIAPVIALTGVSRVALILYADVFLFGALWLMALLVYRELSLPSVLTLLVLLGLSPGLWWLQNRPLSELPFLFFVVLSFVLVERSERAENRRGAILWALFAGLIGGYAVLIRSLGVVLIPALVLPALIRTRRLTLSLLTIVGAGVLVPLITYTAFDWNAGAYVVADHAQGNAGYGALFYDSLIAGAREIPAQVLARLKGYVIDLSVLWPLVTSSRAVHYPLRIVAVGVLLLGAVYRMRRRLGPMDVFAVLYFAALLPWSFGGSRYLMPLIPFLYVDLLSGLEWLWRWTDSRVARGIAIGATAVCTLLLGAQVVEGVREAATPDDQLGPEQALAIVRERTPATAIVLTSEDPRFLILKTGRVGTAIPQHGADWSGYIDRFHVTNAYITEERGSVARFAAVDGWQRLGSTAYGDLYETRPLSRRPARGAMRRP